MENDPLLHPVNKEEKKEERKKERRKKERKKEEIINEEERIMNERMRRVT